MVMPRSKSEFGAGHDIFFSPKVQQNSLDNVEMSYGNTDLVNSHLLVFSPQPYDEQQQQQQSFSNDYTKGIFSADPLLSASLAPNITGSSMNILTGFGTFSSLLTQQSGAQVTLENSFIDNNLNLPSMKGEVSQISQQQSENIEDFEKEVEDEDDVDQDNFKDINKINFQVKCNCQDHRRYKFPCRYETITCHEIKLYLE
ncbi:MAG: hypothetical protein EZS28_024374 [Streblomastix strix]|uniref:Uncharacterized protein n=1 Tax=Streblomastix strix TaxID=222440 RepID=A0A5J4VCA4_9EUKA|nr:MAG: hypothetical protein EZS28_024374 [Streblomastix strix]